MTTHLPLIYVVIECPLGMKNPIIIESKAHIGNREVLDLMKNVMKSNQTISLPKNFKNVNFEKTSGVIFEPDEYIVHKFFGQKRHAIYRRPWIIVKNRFVKYSRIDEPVYILDNGTLYEYYEFKTLKFSNILLKKNGNEFKWTKNTPQNIFERRGDFQNVTLIAVVESDMGLNKLPTDFEKSAIISEIIPDTYEVLHIEGN